MSENLLTRSELKTKDKKLNYLNDKVKLELSQKKKKKKQNYKIELKEGQN